MMPFRLFHDNYFFGSRSDSWKGNRIGFASQLLLLIDALKMSFEAQFMEDFVSGLSYLLELSCDM